MKNKLLTRWRERETLEIMDRALTGTPFRVFSKIRLIDVIGPDPDEGLSRDDRNFLMTAHLDFAVYDRRGNLAPLFGVEFDGPHHDVEPQLTRDIRKNRLCAEAKLPLLRIREPYLVKHEQNTLLDFIVRRFVAWDSEEPSLRRNIQDRASSMTEAQRELLLADGHPFFDRTFRFNLSHRFPGIDRVARRLLQSTLS